VAFLTLRPWLSRPWVSKSSRPWDRKSRPWYSKSSCKAFPSHRMIMLVCGVFSIDGSNDESLVVVVLNTRSSSLNNPSPIIYWWWLNTIWP
jgi:hypothetical protein